MEPADVPVQRRTPRDVGMANMVAAARALLDELVTQAEPRDRETEAARARAQSLARFGPRKP